LVNTSKEKRMVDEIEDFLEEAKDFVEEEKETIALVGGALAATTGLAAAAAAARRRKEQEALEKPGVRVGHLDRYITHCSHCRGTGICRQGKRGLRKIGCSVCIREAGVELNARTRVLRAIPCSVCGGTGKVTL
jgi:hypothetical protein